VYTAVNIVHPPDEVSVGAALHFLVNRKEIGMSKQARGIKVDLWQTNSGLWHIEWAPSECIKEEEQEVYYCLVVF
jgi:hypothetical protein